MKKKRILKLSVNESFKKLYRIMRLTVFFSIMLVLHAMGFETYSQSTKLNLELKNVTLKDVFKEIEKQSDFVFLYNYEAIFDQNQITAKFSEATVEDILDEVLDKNKVDYLIRDRQIIIKEKISDNLKQFLEERGIQSEKRITGNVKGQDGDPIPGVSIIVKGTTIGTITDVDGNFQLDIPADAKILQFSFVGMKTQEFVIAGNSTFNVVMSEEIVGMDEVVVVAYGLQKRENLTGAVSTVNLDNLDSKPITNLSQAFAGMAAGVTAVQSTSQPGFSGSTIRIRGENTLGSANNTPLVVIDGAVGGSLNDISPTDVATISMLKDASSTAMYGARAAAGVILITTKRGSIGDIVVKYDGYSGFDEVTELPDIISNSATYMELIRERKNNPDFPSDELISAFKYDGGADPLHFPNIDWYNYIMGGKAFLQSHSIGIQGGSEKARVAASINYLNQDGIVVNTGNNRIGFRINFDSKISEKFEVGMNIFGNNSKSTNAGEDIQDLLHLIYTTVPYTVPEYDGRYGCDSWTGSGGSNPLAELSSRYSERETNTFIAKAFASFKILPDLKITCSATVNNAQTNVLTLNNPVNLWNFDTNQVEVPGATNSLKESNYRNRIITLNSILNYDVTFMENHNLSLMAGFSQEEDLWNSTYSYGKDLIDESIFVMDAPQDQTSFQIGGNKTLNNLRSYFGRINYNFDSKYLIEGSFRYDGSSKFAKNVRWGFFPSVSVGWNIHREEFIKEADFVSSLKLRSSIGQVGNNTSLGNYSYISTLVIGSNYPFDDVVEPGIYLSELANPNLVWETTTTYGIGLDFGLFNNKITGEFDLFKNRTDGILRRVAAPYFGGIPVSPFQNLAIVDGKGYELAINYRNRDKAFKYSVGLTLTHSENEIVSFNDGQFQEISGNFINKVGYAINSIYTYETEGIFRTQDQIDNHATQPQAPKIGDLMYQDQLTIDNDGDGNFDDVDGIINAEDRKIMDPAIPKINMGLNLNFEYKAFDMNILLQGSLGYKNFVYIAPALPFNYPGRGLTGKEWINAYHETRNPDPNTNMPRLDENSGNFKASDYWMHDFSFVRFKTIQIGYNLPTNLISHVGLTRGRIYVNGQNIFTIEKVPHFDPESVATVYPLTKTLTIGVQLIF